MPLGGPRPNPKPANIPSLYDEYHYPSSDVPSEVAYSNRPGSSRLTYPHESSFESGTTLLEPLPSEASNGLNGLTHAEGIRQEWHRNRTEAPQDVHNRPDGEVERAPSPSIGPWDSASQRSLPHHPPFPLPQPTQIPLNTDTRGVRRLKTQPSYGGLSYIDEEGAYYKSDSPRPASMLENVEMRGLVNSAVGMAGGENEPNRSKYAEYGTSLYPYPSSLESTNRLSPPSYLQSWLFPTGLDRLLALLGVKEGRYSLEQAVERKKRGMAGQRWPVAAWGLAIGMSRN